MHNIKSGLKALEAVSCYVFVSRSLPLVLLPSVIMFWSRPEMDSRVRCLNAGNVPTRTWNGKFYICSHTQKRFWLMCTQHMKAHITLHRDRLCFLKNCFTNLKMITIDRTLFSRLKGKITAHFLFLSSLFLLLLLL